MIDEDDEFISKSQRKRDAEAVFDLGRRLVELSPAMLARIELPTDVREAVVRAMDTHQRVARKRELQYLAKVLRHESDVQPIFFGLEALARPAHEDTARLHRLENWRDRLLNEGNPAVSELKTSRPELDVQAIRKLIRQASRESERQQPSRAARALFRQLRELDDSTPLP